MIDGARKLNLPIKSYIMILKPIIAGIVPQSILMKYHRNKFNALVLYKQRKEPFLFYF